MSNDDDYDYIFKLVLIGDSGVGKTNILSRYISNEFSLASRATVGVEFGSKIVKINDKKIKIQIWDTAGQERYKSITNAYYKGAKGAFVVYDITREATFKNTDTWIGEIKTNGSEDVLIVLIGNKSDLEDQREVSLEEATKKAEQNKILFCETSALQATNIDHAFHIMIEQVAKKLMSDKENKEKDKKGEDSKGITLDTSNDSTEEKKEKKCC